MPKSKWKELNLCTWHGFPCKTMLLEWNGRHPLDARLTFFLSHQCGCQGSFQNAASLQKETTQRRLSASRLPRVGRLFTTTTTTAVRTHEAALLSVARPKKRIQFVQMYSGYLTFLTCSHISPGRKACRLQNAHSYSLPPVCWTQHLQNGRTLQFFFFGGGARHNCKTS